MKIIHFLAVVCTLIIGPGLSYADSPNDVSKGVWQPNAYAVIIGISQYREEVIPKVPYAVTDAEVMAAVLEHYGGIPKSHIRLLTESRATGNDLRAIGDWLRMRAKSDSTIYIYFAGHGTPNAKTGDAYLVPWDGHPDFPSGLYPLKELYTTLNALPSQEIIVILDSCFSGATGRSVLAKGTRPMVIAMENPLLAVGKAVVFAGATGNQITSDYDPAQHGLFTYYLIEGLSGKADKNKDKLVTLHELFPYVKEHVAHTAVEELNREQTPVLLPEEQILGQRLAKPLSRIRELTDSSPLALIVEDVLREASDEKALGAGKPNVPKEIKEARARPYSPPPPNFEVIDSKDGAPMVLVPAGKFLYGNNNRRLSLPAFYVDKYEVTTRLYSQFLQATSRAPTVSCPAYCQQPYDWSQQVALVESGDRPVVNVYWDDAEAYCRHYGKRLPTEQEWEKAARGTDGRKYPWGNEEPTSRHALFRTTWNGYDTLAVVGSHEAGASPYGVHDLAGNVWEWTSSDYDSSSKVIRGGSWFDTASGLRSTYRRTWSLLDVIGFRCVQDEVPK